MSTGFTDLSPYRQQGCPGGLTGSRRHGHRPRQGQEWPAAVRPDRSLDRKVWPLPLLRRLAIHGRLQGLGFSCRAGCVTLVPSSGVLPGDSSRICLALARSPAFSREDIFCIQQKRPQPGAFVFPISVLLEVRDSSERKRSIEMFCKVRAVTPDLQIEFTIANP